MLVGKGWGRNGRVVAMAGTSVASAATEHMGCVALGAFLSARERARARERDLKSTKSSSFSKIKVYFQ